MAITVAGGRACGCQEADPAASSRITGTKGKSTTTAITGHLLTRLGHRA